MIKRSKPAFHWQCFRSHQVSQDNWYSLTTSTPQHGARLLRHGGLRSKHSHRHTWLLAELFFSVALSVLCSFWHVFWCVNEESVTATRSQNHVAVHNTSTQAEFCVCETMLLREILERQVNKCNRERSAFQMYINRIIYKALTIQLCTLNSHGCPYKTTFQTVRRLTLLHRCDPQS